MRAVWRSRKQFAVNSTVKRRRGKLPSLMVAAGPGDGDRPHIANLSGAWGGLGVSGYRFVALFAAKVLRGQHSTTPARPLFWQESSLILGLAFGVPIPS